jgi:predicted 3-demethylubiquinone-9 3-methyltransferase (glyoxalase superfamily)
LERRTLEEGPLLDVSDTRRQPVSLRLAKDKFGLSWQIMPKRFIEIMREGTPGQQGRVMGAMMQMGKFVIAELEEAMKD